MSMLSLNEVQFVQKRFYSIESGSFKERKSQLNYDYH